jgi:1,4-dihydroxy-2-naphthoate polyprenyltransferase
VIALATAERDAQRGASPWRGLLRVADPKITLASVASMMLGLGAAARGGPIAWPWLLLTVAGVFFVEVAKNASGEVFDFDSGTDLAVTADDRSPFSGGKRVLVEGLMTRRQAGLTAGIFYLLAVGTGLAIVVLREPRVLPLGMLGVGLAFFYHAPPLQHAYRGLGEIAVAVAYGPLTACGTYLVQRRDLGLDVLLPSLVLALLIAAFLWINEFPDYLADEHAGKRTLVVRLGRPRAAKLFGVIVGAAWLLLALLPLAGLPPAIWLGLLGAPLSLRAALRLRASPTTTSRIVPAQGWTLQSFVLMAAGAAAGLALSR